MTDIGDILAIVGIAFWVFVPAMLPNTFAVFLGGGPPVDFGKSWKGRRILGDGKTWRGFIAGALVGGFVIGMAQYGLADVCGSADHWGYGDGSDVVIVSLALGFGSLIGDMLGSFIKRRIGIERGAKAPILDQYDFVFGAFLFLAIFDWSFMYNTYLCDWQHLVGLAALLLMIWFLHRGTNIIGYRIGVKNQPW